MPGWEWLAEERLPRIAAVIGRWTSQDWTAADIADHVRRWRGERPWPDQVTSPAGYLKSLLVTIAPTPSSERIQVAAEGAELRSHQAAVRCDAERRTAAAVPPGQRSAEGLFAALRTKLTGRGGTAGTPGDTDQAEEAWPEVRQPGSGPSTQDA